MAINNGGRAFPMTGFVTETGPSDYDNVPQPGMSFRSYAAVHLLAAILTSPVGGLDAAVADAVDAADLLIMELEK